MKKAYIVTYINNKAGVKLNSVQGRMQAIGAYRELSHTARMASWLLIPDDETETAASLKNSIFSVLSPFEDSLSIVRIETRDVAETDGMGSSEFLSRCTDAPSDEPLNFSRFKNRHEAYAQYKLERPMWIYADGIQYGVGVDFSEWCWLPVKKDGLYDKRKYQSYING